MKQSTTIHFSNDHPCVAGHFPGNPIIPGALIISEISKQSEKLIGRPFASVKKVKFSNPLTPEQEALLELESNGDQLKFSVSVGSTLILGGKASLL